MKGFIIYPTYRIIDNKAYVYLYGRLENGESFLTVNYTRPYFYIRSSDLQKAKTLAKFDTESVDLKSFKDEVVVKVILDIPGDVPGLRKSFEAEGIPCFEADIRFAYRFIIDNDLHGVCDIDGEFEKTDLIDRVYKDAKVSAVEPYDVKLRLLSIDIETNQNATEIFSIAVDTNDTKEVYITAPNEVKGATAFKTEKELLIHFKKRVMELDPDIITGWNVVDFDFDVLERRFKHHKIPFTIAKDGSDVKMRRESSFFKDSKADVVGRQILDGLQLLKSSFIKLSDYKLDTAAQTFLGTKKTETFVDKRQEIFDMHKSDPERLAKYNLVDATLVLQILEKLDLIEIVIERSILTRMQPDRVNASIASLDNLYIYEANKRGYVCNSASSREREERIKGGYVQESKPGIYDYIIVLDFKSLYPSVMRTFNIDPLSHRDDGELVAPNGARFINTEGILPELLQRLWEARDTAKKEKNSVKSYAIKVTMNSFFGVLANPNCRFFSLDVANAITAYGREILQETATEIQKMGYRVIYGDTDSEFIKTNVDSLEKAKEIGITIQNHVNDMYNKKVGKLNRKSFIEIEFEKTYKKFILPMTRRTDDADTGAKKRYAGILIKDGKEKMDFVGLEFVRRDWTEVAKTFQLTVLQKIFNNEEIHEYVGQFVKDLKDGKMDDQLIYKKALRKDLASYTKTTPPHVKAARLLDKIESNLIQYYMTIDGPQPVEKLTSKIDYDHYIDKQIRPIADSILVFFDRTFDDIVSDSRQKSLFDY